METGSAKTASTIDIRIDDVQSTLNFRIGLQSLRPSSEVPNARPDSENSRQAAEKGAEWVPGKVPEKQLNNIRNSQKNCVSRLFFRLFFRCFTVTVRDPLATHSAPLLSYTGRPFTGTRLPFPSSSLFSCPCFGGSAQSLEKRKNALLGAERAKSLGENSTFACRANKIPGKTAFLGCRAHKKLAFFGGRANKIPRKKHFWVQSEQNPWKTALLGAERTKSLGKKITTFLGAERTKSLG